MFRIEIIKKNLTMEDRRQTRTTATKQQKSNTTHSDTLGGAMSVVPSKKQKKLETNEDPNGVDCNNKMDDGLVCNILTSFQFT